MVPKIQTRRRALALKHSSTRHPNPFDTCPDEILGEIFRSADNGPEIFETRCPVKRPYPFTPFYLSSVCRRWRLIAISIPALWAYICIDDSHWPHRVSNPKQKKKNIHTSLKGHKLQDFVEACFTRSGSHPLYMHWNFSSTAASSSLPLPPDHLLVSTLAKESHRWREMVFFSRGEASIFGAILKHEDFKGLPILHKICISEGELPPKFNLPGPGSQYFEAPCLSSVFLRSNIPSIAIIDYISLTHITYLHLSIRSPGRLHLVASIIAESSCLKYLHLSLHHSWIYTAPLQPNCTMDLPHLSRLSIATNSRCLWHFLSHMHVPTLTHLHISEQEAWGPDPQSPNIADVGSFLGAVPSSLQALAVQCSRMDFPRIRRLIAATQPLRVKVNLADIVLGSLDEEEEGVSVYTFMEDVVSCTGYASRIEELAIFNQAKNYEGADIDDGFIEEILSSLHRAAERSPLFGDPRSLCINIYSHLPIPREALEVFNSATLPQCIDINLHGNWAATQGLEWTAQSPTPDPKEDLSDFF
ncbi:hypothetical protein D9611_004225 [Ephemerocybe angulata]|uniref:F-box domain-containing protein n=1 Tax=Ephemerocybe angulata TaxID=980116 RepID=A0A8H5BJZ7_9AGAR|nr:hypothetical protein D9611_004225 [Tulosesus angulatus]